MVKNRSAFHPTHTLKDSIEYVYRHFPSAGRHLLVIEDLDDANAITGGRASLFANGNCRVDLFLGGGFSYPRPTSTLHCERAGETVLHSFQEELILVLAHEFAHLEHFTKGILNLPQEEEEFYAETTAQQVLNAWRWEQGVLSFSYTVDGWKEVGTNVG